MNRGGSDTAMVGGLTVKNKITMGQKVVKPWPYQPHRFASYCPAVSFGVCNKETSRSVDKKKDTIFFK